MSKVRKVIQLHHQGSSKLFISKYLSLSRNTVKKYIALYQLINLSIEDINQKNDAELEELFSSSKTQNLSPKLIGFWPSCVVTKPQSPSKLLRISVGSRYKKIASRSNGKHPRL